GGSSSRATRETKMLGNVHRALLDLLNQCLRIPAQRKRRSRNSQGGDHSAFVIEDWSCHAPQIAPGFLVINRVTLRSNLFELVQKRPVGGDRIEGGSRETGRLGKLLHPLCREKREHRLARGGLMKIALLAYPS